MCIVYDAAPLDPKAYLCSYWPLAKTRAGRDAVLKFGLPPFVNGMSRREPDFENPFPAITASSRAKNFAPRLRPGDTVVYITSKGLYGDRKDRHWRLVAVLEVAERFETHAAAADWYRARRLPLPSNCVADGNPPLPVFLTLAHGALHDGGWDATCIRRAATTGTLLVCRPRFLDLHASSALTPEDLAGLFGTIPNTRTPPVIAPAAFDALLARCALHAARRAA